MSRFVYDYYDVEVPGDLSDDVEVLGQQAIDEARERARVYALPADWMVTLIKGEVGDFNVTFRVRRRRNRVVCFIS
jgi:hypothetical protein